MTNIESLSKTISSRKETLKPHQIMFCLNMKPIILNLVNDKKCQKNKIDRLAELASKQLEHDKYLCSTGELSEKEVEEDKRIHTQLVSILDQFDQEIQSYKELQKNIDTLIKRQPVVG